MIELGNFRQKFGPFALAAALAAPSLGCQTVSTAEFDALQRLSTAMAQARRDYRLLPGDTVKVVVIRQGTPPPEYQQTITVQPDGRITLVGIDRAIQAEGKTVPELEAIVRQLYETVFRKEGGAVEFAVTLQFLTSQKNAWLPDQVYVTGEVFRSLAVPYRQRLTALQAVANAGGWKYTAEPARVVILRADPEGRTVSREVNLSAVVSHSGDDLELLPGDVVFVPMSTIAKVNLFVEFYLRGLIPVNPSTIRTLAATF
ncbi:MAG: polysaccharide biosynthesis/export family protein [Planctomycetota bacterium]